MIILELDGINALYSNNEKEDKIIIKTLNYQAAADG
jgi:hypothetical protein